VGSYLHTYAHNRLWYLRIDDLDRPRNQDGATDQILTCLESFGLEWDGEVMYQHRQLASYQAALERLITDGLCFHCICSRKTLRQNRQDLAISVYPGTCRDARLPSQMSSIRIRVPSDPISFYDHLQGHYSQQLDRSIGDFVIKRGDGIFAYQLAVVVDDQALGITTIVRGADLLDNTPRQIYLQDCLGYRQPDYLHLPIATNQAGQKLSKQTGARPIDAHNIGDTLYQVLAFLGQSPPRFLQHEHRDVIWQWAKENWHSSRIPISGTVVL